MELNLIMKMVKMMKRNKILIDLNIILDVFLKREPFFQDSYKVFDLCYSQKIHGIIAAHSLSTLWYVLRKHLSDEECRKIISSLLNSFEIAQIDKSHIKAAIERKNFKDFEDCLQDECASSFNADFIITRDKNDFLNAKILPLLPTEFLHAV